MSEPVYVIHTPEFPDGRQVPLEEWIAIEKLAGFSGPGHYSDPPSPATAGFTAANFRGTIRYPDSG
jgi:hypothetical protein